MKITFIGATHEVTGSCTLIEIGGKDRTLLGGGGDAGGKEESLVQADHKAKICADFLTKKGVPFRDAYREVGMRVQNGTYEHDGRELNHTHEGSIGNLCLAQIRQKFERNIIDFVPAMQAEEELMR